jgi:putative endonuclease
MRARSRRSPISGVMPNEQRYYVYILASLSGTLYIGVTNDLRHRVWQHKNHVFEGFTAEYGVDRLVHWESYGFVQQAIAREKQLKGWVRRKKIVLLEKTNPSWKDLSADWFREELRVTERKGFGE